MANIVEQINNVGGIELIDLDWTPATMAWYGQRIKDGVRPTFEETDAIDVLNRANETLGGSVTRLVEPTSGHVASIALEPSKSVAGTATYSDASGAGATLSFTARTDAGGDVVETEIQDSSMSSLMADFTLSFSGNTLVFTPVLVSGIPANGTLRATLTTA